MKDTGIMIAGYPLMQDSFTGYQVRTDKHDYSFYELVCIGGTATSDILMVMVDDYERDEDSIPTNIGWIYGATSFPHDQYVLQEVAEYIQNYEDSHLG